MKAPAHPVDEVAAAFYHACLAAFLLAGLLFHVGVAAYAVYLYRMADSKMLWVLQAVAFYHGAVAGLLVIGLAFHVYAASRHWCDRISDQQPKDYPRTAERE